ncbi:HD domain-containing protein [Photobacterium aphoticum]|uniref:HD domain-containing protein n=1 Tax=Photobacterium aphoticum TaxID=754436 RepID=UPI0009E36F99|nr:HD domain-containing protein [Photobacterium aphoticum]PSU55438.1 HD domain-containing protein [Photobacterium aphoticum]GHA49156.1 phosphohydrolase [Photobacterium aphoticum]
MNTPPFSHATAFSASGLTDDGLQQLESQCAAFLAAQPTADAAHDIDHIHRVVATAKQLAEQEQAECAIVVPAAWLHDCVTLPKNHPQRHQASALAAQAAVDFLTGIGYPQPYLDGIYHAIEAHSYSANIAVKSVEAAIVQDADRIDALGAIGIARCIQVSTGFNSALYSTNDPFGITRERDDKAFCIDHFYTKLFKLADTMNTDAGREEAARRTAYMKGFLRQLGHEIGEGYMDEGDITEA